MAQVVLIPTGRLEHAALGSALKRLFPDHDFIARPKDKHLDGFTSTDVTCIRLGGPVRTNVEELAAELVAAVSPGQRGRPADFAVVVEDLELINDHQPDRVVQVFREAADRHIHGFWSSQQTQLRTTALVRERCSFHLFRPMTEAYLFAIPLLSNGPEPSKRPSCPPLSISKVFRRSIPHFYKSPTLSLIGSRICRTGSDIPSPIYITCATQL